MSLQDEDLNKMEEIVLRHPSNHTKSRMLQKDQISDVETMVIDVLQDGKQTVEFPTIEEIRALRQADVNRLDDGVKRIMNPHIYHISLTQKLWDVKQELIKAAMS